MISVTSLTVPSHGISFNTATNPHVILASTSDKTVYESSFQNFGFYAEGRYWVFFENTMFVCENMTGCLFFTSSTDGASWTGPVNVGIHVTDSDWSIASDAKHVFYVRYPEHFFDSVCNLPLLVGRGVLHRGGSITWQAEQTVLSGGPQTIFLNDVIRIDSKDQLWVGYQELSAGRCGGSGDQTPHVIHSAGTDYTLWTGDTVLSKAHSNNWDIDIAALPGGQVFAAYWINTFDLHGRLFNGTVWGSEEQISYPSDSTDVNSFVFASGANVYAIWYDTNSETFRFGSRISNGQWAIENIGTGEAKSATDLGRYSLPVTATFDPSQSKFYLYWFNTTRGAIDQWSGSGNSWTKTTGVFSTALQAGEYTIACYFKPVTSSASAIAVMWVDQPTQPFHLNFGLAPT